MDLQLRNLQNSDYSKPHFKGGFWRCYGSSWSKVIASNALLLITNALSMVIALMIVMFVFPLIFPFFLPDKLRELLISTGMSTEEAADAESVENLYFLMTMFSSMMLVGMMMVVNGPIHSAISYYFRNLMIGDASFKADFKKGLKENWKKSLGACILSTIVSFILLYNIGYYQAANFGYVSVIARGFFTCLLVFWVCMQIYVYPLIACVDLDFKGVIKNAAILTVSNFPASMGVFLLEVVLYLALPLVLMSSFKQVGYAISVLFYLLFSYGFISFLSTHLTWKSIQKLIDRRNGTA